MVLTHGIPPEFRGGVHLFILNRHTPSGQSRVYRVTQLRTNGVHSRQSAGTGPVNLKVLVIPNECCFAFLSHTQSTGETPRNRTHRSVELFNNPGLVTAVGELDKMPSRGYVFAAHDRPHLNILTFFPLLGDAEGLARCVQICL